MALSDERLQVKEILHELNPHVNNKVNATPSGVPLNKHGIDEKIGILNQYLKDTYPENDITRFTHGLLLKIFHFEAKLNVDGAVKAACDVARKTGIILNIGGNIGKFTKMFLERNDREIVLFEPVPMYRDYCRLLFATSGNVTIIGAAASDSDGSATICVDATNLGWNTLVHEKRTERMTEYTCQTIRLDTYFLHNPAPDIGFIKIDVEGAEYKVFAGFRETLAQLAEKPPIFLEIGWGRGHPHFEKEVEEFEWLMKNGWQRFEYDFDRTRDVLLLPDSNSRLDMP